MSVLRVNQNPIAINASRNLKITGMAISKSLERLSSGLRINRAADDAAGLSISEKLRGQIRGINRASSNAMDGISLIQTAEGALNEVHSILQRQRELAVQAANGIYTAGDRQAIQQEVTQLTDEINRIARTTEFNTKTLLDGTLGALVSTDDYTKVRAAVVGNVGNGGNFVLKAVARTTGQLQVQKTDVFSTTQAADAVGRLNYLQTWGTKATLETAGVDGIGNTGVYQLDIMHNSGGAGATAVNSPVNGRLVVSGAVAAAGTETLVSILQTHEINSVAVDKVLLTVQTGSGVQTFSITVSAANTLASVGTKISAALGALTGGLSGVNANGEISLTLDASVAVLDTKFVDVDGSGTDFYLSFNANGLSNAFHADATVSFYNNGAAFSAQLATLRLYVGSTFYIGDVNTGRITTRFDTRYDWNGATANAQSDIISWSKHSGHNSLQTYGRVWQTGPPAESGTFLISAILELSYAVFEFDNQKYTSLVAGGTDMNIALQTARGARLSNAQGSLIWSVGTVGAGAIGGPLENVRIGFDGNFKSGETATFNVSTNNILTADQQNTLASLNRFQQFGVFNGKKNVEFQIYLRGTDKTTTVNISQNDTLEDLAGKISLALYDPSGSGVIKSTLINSGILNPQQLPDLVHVNTIGSAKGTVSITTPVPGAEIVFSGDEALLKALSLIEVQKSKAPIYSINAFNIEKNQSVGSVMTDSNEINGLLPGLRVFFDNTLGLRLDPEPPISVAGGVNIGNTFSFPLPLERPVISLSGTVESMFIHVAPRDFSLQIGANEGQTIESFIGDMGAEALGVEGLLVASSELAQQAISIVDEAINRVSTQRSRLGAIQNRLENTIRNLDVAAENLTSSESRIRDADVAAETINMTRNQILLQAGTAAMAQANQLPQVALQLLR